MIIYLPYYRRLLVRTAAVWLVIRILLEGLARKSIDSTLHPAAALGLIAFVLAIDATHARAMRESIFRANMGIAVSRVMAAQGILLAGLELVWRALL